MSEDIVTAETIIACLRKGCVCSSEFGKCTRCYAAETIEALRGEVATLTTQNTAWLDKYGDCQNQMYAAIERADMADAKVEALRAENARLTAQVRFASETDPAMRAEAAEAEAARLKGALEPFARFAKMFDALRALPRTSLVTSGEWYSRDDAAGRHVLTVEMFDEARKAFAGEAK